MEGSHDGMPDIGPAEPEAGVLARDEAAVDVRDQEGQVGHEEAVGSQAEIDVLAGDPEPAQNDSEADSGGEDSDGGSEADDEADADDGDSGEEDSEPVKQPKRWKGKGREIDCGATATSGPCVAALPKSGPSTSKVAPIVSLVPYLDSDDEDED